MQIQTLPELCSSFIPQGQTQVWSCISRNWVYTKVKFICTYKSSWNPNSNTQNLIGGSVPAPSILSPSFLHHHFISLTFPQREIRQTLQKFHFLFFIYISLKLHNLPSHKSGLSVHTIAGTGSGDLMHNIPSLYDVKFEICWILAVRSVYGPLVYAETCDY